MEYVIKNERVRDKLEVGVECFGLSGVDWGLGTGVWGEVTESPNE